MTLLKIVKALECCSRSREGEPFSGCKDCPFGKMDFPECAANMAHGVLKMLADGKEKNRV